MASPAAELKYHDEHRHATWLELFFDLVFVAAIGVITHHLAHVHDGHIPSKDLVLYPLEFVPLWWIWATHTLFANRFDTDSKGHRLASLAVMFLIVTMSGFLGASLSSGATAFIGFCMAARFVLALMFLSGRGRLEGARTYADSMAGLIGVGLAVSGVSLLLDGVAQQVVFFAGIGVEMVGAVVLGNRTTSVPVHREHLVERVGLLSIILLGESVISMVAGLRDIEWTATSTTAAITGFVMIVSIWWIYFDSFNTLERAKRLTHGYVLLFSHVLFCLGLGILASLIGHVVLDDIGKSDYRLLAISGLTLFYLGKQSVYWYAFPPFRPNLVINSVVCIGITVGSTYLPTPAHALMGMTCGLLIYVFSNFRWTLTKDVSEFLVDE